MGKRIISRRRGAGTGRYRSPSHRHHGAIYHPSASIVGEAKVRSIAMAPGRTAPVAEVETSTGERVILLASAGLGTGDSVSLNAGRLDRGSILPLRDIPDGTLVSNLEVNPFDGGRLVRAAGTSALVVSHAGREVTIQLPSGNFKSFLATCRAQVGTVAGGDGGNAPLSKPGRSSGRLDRSRVLHSKSGESR